jgi:surface antigen
LQAVRDYKTAPFSLPDFAMRKQTAFFVAGLVAILQGSLALADPPAKAPAHGWRKKHDPYYQGYTGTKWERDYDISEGRCNRQEIGAVLGGVVGGAIGSKTGPDEHRAVAIILGAAAGALIGSRIGRELDEADRGCFAHALEIGAPDRRVSWVNPESGVRFALVPGAAGPDAKNCRTFRLTATRDGKMEERRGTACQSGVGEWKIRD